MAGEVQTGGKMTVGFKNVYYALMLTDVRPNGATLGSTTYATPKRLAGGISANLNPNSTTQTVYVDDVPSETVTSQGLSELELGIDYLEKAVAAEVFGMRIDSNGVLVEGQGTNPPYLALGYQAETTDSGYKYTWLYKGKLQVPAEEMQTKGESIEIKTGTVNGQFINRNSDGERKVSVHSNDADVAPEVLVDWFKNVYQPDYTVTP
jgi:phi13 family phage major tail protein